MKIVLLASFSTAFIFLKLLTMSNHFIKMRNVKFPTCTSFHKNFDPLTCFIPHSFLLQNIESSLKSANGLLQNRLKRLKCIGNRECDTSQVVVTECYLKKTPSNIYYEIIYNELFSGFLNKYKKIVFLNIFVALLLHTP